VLVEKTAFRRGSLDNAGIWVSARDREPKLICYWMFNSDEKFEWKE
jgi:hypothetical protein